MALGLAGCDPISKFECQNLINALAAIASQHVNAKPVFDPAAFLVAQTSLLAQRHVQAPAPPRVPKDSLKQCIGTMDLLRSGYPKTEPREFTLELLSNYTRMWDPHSSAMSEQALAGLSGFLSGFGFMVDRSDETGRVEVVDVIAGSPAHSAGLKEGMFIWTVNRRYVREISATELISIINDRTADELLLGVLGGTAGGKPTQSFHQIRIPRGRYEASAIKLNTFRLHRARSDVNLGYVKLRSFVGVQAFFAESLKTMKSFEALILDLRNNSGGEIQAANDVADLLLSDPETFVGLMGRDKQVREIVKMKNLSSAWDGPLVVLVNSTTKSAAEILAGSLQDYGAIVVGTQTFGKGTRQQMIPLDNYHLSGGLFLTDAFTVRPSGKLIQFHGVTPDVQLPLRGDAKAEKDYPRALIPPADLGPLPGYDPSLVVSRSRHLRSRLMTLESQIRDYIEAQSENASQEDLQLEAAKRVALFMAEEADANNTTHSAPSTGNTPQLELPFIDRDLF
ncbi:MAG: hypothetical protein HY074_07810 [Deltaproteobacteria bacterium]|nr:hypothetical protein [Deltaproteobacteria bacterium]